ncbi:MAG: alpha/beta hydrolase [Gammaproteobacteria bacterium]|nr:MAG: alpha/beta hydrolase [Gammaproteobacteria bacterium]
MLKQYLFLLLSLVFISACQSTRTSQPFNWPNNASVATAQFKHMVVTQAGNKNTERLHVYVEGDGLPFRNRFQISTDPSPRNPMMLQLMAQDKTESLYLGRPCYFTNSNPLMADNLCDYHYWTDARYSDAIVTSMTNVLRQQIGNHHYNGITLIGHSGGGALVMLMAARMPEVDQVVTLAGNLDTKAWTRYHHFSTLKNSLNPADLNKTVLPARQLHFMGDKDDNIPPVLMQYFLTRIGQQGKILEGADHNCCWQLRWQELLLQIDKQIANDENR